MHSNRLLKETLCSPSSRGIPSAARQPLSLLASMPTPSTKNLLTTTLRRLRRSWTWPNQIACPQLTYTLAYVSESSGAWPCYVMVYYGSHWANHSLYYPLQLSPMWALTSPVRTTKCLGSILSGPPTDSKLLFLYYGTNKTQSPPPPGLLNHSETQTGAITPPTTKLPGLQGQQTWKSDS